MGLRGVNLNLNEVKKNKYENNIINYDNRENFNKYLNEVSKLQPLSREEEVAIFAEIEATGDKRLIDKICKHNMLFVVAVARQFYRLLPKESTLTFEDLISEGNMGLCLAIQKFDYKTGNKFISYAVWHIQAQIFSCIRTHVKTIRIPPSARKIMTSYNDKESKLEQKLSRTPTTLEVFEEMVKDDSITESYDLAKLDELIKMSRFEFSLNEIIISPKNGSSSDKMELGEMLKTDDNLVDEEIMIKERHQILYQMMEKLPRIIKSYLIDFYGLGGVEPLSLKEMGEKYDEEPNTIKIRMKKYIMALKKLNMEHKDFFFPTPDYEELRLQKGRDKNAIYLI